MVVRKSRWLNAHSSRHQVGACALGRRYPVGVVVDRPAGWCLSVAVVFGAACGPKPVEPTVEPVAAPAALEQPAPPPPEFTWKAPEPFKSRDGSKVVPPPDLEAETWRIMVNQTEPMQRKNPWWQPLPASKTVVLEMAPGAKFRCMVAPLQVEAEPDEDQEELLAWQLKRNFLCSSDEYRTWTETQLRVRLAADGSRKVGPDAGVLLRQRADDGKVVETFVVMRSEKDTSGPTYGPPKILPQKKGDDGE